MKAPLIGLVSDTMVLAAALPIGIIFGWFLERGGMGSARKLAGQFYLTDLTVFKVMFSAIVTAALGVFWLSRIGWLDISKIAVPETFVLPQLLGGLVFGVGFVMGGLCPGTSCVAAATGRVDGMALIAGMLLGVLGFGELLPRFEEFYRSTARGALTLDSLLHIDRSTATFLLVAMALAGFAGAEAIERRSAR